MGQSLVDWGNIGGEQDRPKGKVVFMRGNELPIAAIAKSGDDVMTLLRRHQAGDWGEICAEDREENELSLKHGCRLLSTYKLKDKTPIWVLTEADRSATTIILASEY